MKRLLLSLALPAAAFAIHDPTALRRWMLEMHRRQIELLKIDWGNPGFCTEWERDYDAKTKSCGRSRKPVIERSIFRKGANNHD